MEKSIHRKGFWRDITTHLEKHFSNRERDAVVSEEGLYHQTGWMKSAEPLLEELVGHYDPHERVG